MQPIPASVSYTPQHSVVVRVTHWITALSFFALLISGIAILVAHPRLYWGETGAVGTPSLLDLPMPFVFGPSGWGRSLHFLAAWVCVLTGLVYVLLGALTRHFTGTLLPSRTNLTGAAIQRAVSNHLHPKRLREEESQSYNVLQQFVYSGVVFGLFPLMIVTGLAMSPAITSIIPVLVTMFGGQQSARTVHFFAAVLLVGFLLVHVSMVSVAGFTARLRAMTLGRAVSTRIQHE